MSNELNRYLQNDTANLLQVDLGYLDTIVRDVLGQGYFVGEATARALAVTVGLDQGDEVLNFDFWIFKLDRSLVLIKNPQIVGANVAIFLQDANPFFALFTQEFKQFWR